MLSSRFIVSDGNLISIESSVNIDIQLLHNVHHFSWNIPASCTRIFFLKEQLENINKALKFLELETPPEFEVYKLDRLITRLLNANKQLKDALISFIFFKNDKAITGTSYYIFTGQAGISINSYNRTGLRIGLFREILKPKNDLSSFPFSNSYFFLKANLFCRQNNLDDCLILDDRGCIIEATSSGIFFCKGKQIFYPSLDEGRRMNVLQEKIAWLGTKTGYNVIEGCNFLNEDVHSLDEIFLVDELKGIRWVVAYEDQRFYNKISAHLFSNLKLIFEEL